MNEDQIVAQLSAKVEPQSSPVHEPIIEEGGEKVPQPETGQTPEEAEDPFKTFHNKQTLKEHFQVILRPEKTTQINEQISSVLSFAQAETGSKDMTVILSYISRMEQQLGNSYKPNRLNRFQQFITVKTQARLLQNRELNRESIING